jgi:hypothetical protein
MLFVFLQITGIDVRGKCEKFSFGAKGVFHVNGKGKTRTNYVFSRKMNVLNLLFLRCKLCQCWSFRVK